MKKLYAALTAAGAIVVAQETGRRYSPTPDHKKTRRWYESLEKPSYTPPGPVFGVIWCLLDGLIGYAGYRLMTAPPSRARRIALWAWWMSVAGVAGFPYVAFGKRCPGGALAISAGLIGTSGLAIGTASRVDKRAAMAGLPLFAWLLYATLLQEEIWRRNPEERA